MKAAFRATKPSECWDWISQQELLALAARAFKRAKAECRPPPGQSFVSDPPWSSAEDFCDNLTRLLVLHVQAAAHGAGIPNNEYAPVQLSRWYSEMQAPTPPDDALIPTYEEVVSCVR